MFRFYLVSQNCFPHNQFLNQESLGLWGRAPVAGPVLTAHSFSSKVVLNYHRLFLTGIV